MNIYITGYLNGMYMPLFDELNYIDFDRTKDKLICIGNLSQGYAPYECIQLLDEDWFISCLTKLDKEWLVKSNMDMPVTDTFHVIEDQEFKYCIELKDSIIEVTQYHKDVMQQIVSIDANSLSPKSNQIIVRNLNECLK